MTVSPAFAVDDDGFTVCDNMPEAAEKLSCFRDLVRSQREGIESITEASRSQEAIKKRRQHLLTAFLIKTRPRPTLPHSYPCSTIGAERLNFRVRNGNGCGPFAIKTGNI